MNCCKQGASGVANNGQGVAHEKVAAAEVPAKESSVDGISDSSLSGCDEVLLATATVVRHCSKLACDTDESLD